MWLPLLAKPKHTGSTVFQLAVTVRSSMIKPQHLYSSYRCQGNLYSDNKPGSRSGRVPSPSGVLMMFNTPPDRTEPEKVESGQTNNINTRGERHCLLSFPGKPRCPNVGTNPGHLTHLFPAGSSGAWRQLRPRVRQAAPGAPPVCGHMKGVRVFVQSRERCTNQQMPSAGRPQPQAAQP